VAALSYERQLLRKIPTDKILAHFYRTTRMHSADYAVSVSVFLSVCPSHAGIVSKRLKTSLNW